jgi:hypothetical protein
MGLFRCRAGPHPVPDLLAGKRKLHFGEIVEAIAGDLLQPCLLHPFRLSFDGLEFF